MRFFAPVLAATALVLTACGGKSGVVPKISGQDLVLGAPTAKVELIEYASASCPHCADFAAEAMPEIKAKYIDTGKVRYTLREVILHDADSYGVAGFMLARCAGEDKYHPVLDAVFHGQRAVGPSPMRDVLLQVAQSAGMNEQQFTACVTDEKGAQDLMKTVQTNLNALGQRGTPAVFVDGQYIEPKPGEAPAVFGGRVQQAIEAALKK